jgi:hypothetical protein
LVPAVLAQPFASVAIPTHVMRVVIGLEQFVLLNDPGHLCAHVGANHGSGNLSMVAGSEQVADVVDQSAHDQIVIGAVAARTSCSLQRMTQAGERVAFHGVVQIAQCAQHPIRELLRELPLGLIEEQVVLARSLFHLRKADEPIHVCLQSAVE